LDQQSLVAGVTVFRPEAPRLLALVDRLSADGLDILLWIDGPTGLAIDAALQSELVKRPRVQLLQSAKNEGIGTGLNGLVDRAEAKNCHQIIFFDQDSLPPPAMAAHLQRALSKLHALGRRPAAIGPRPVVPDGEEGKAPHYGNRRGLPRLPDLRPVDFLITSGCLVSLDALRTVGPFRSDYRMDAIDTEWCFRAWHKGWSIWEAEDVEMEHRVGNGVVRLGPLRFPLQSESRMATYVRNQLHSLVLVHVPLSWKLRSIVYLPAQVLAYIASGQGRGRRALLLWRAIREVFRKKPHERN
jgi:rhamnosyltransferase